LPRAGTIALPSSPHCATWRDFDRRDAAAVQRDEPAIDR
jgi:hypothetical protein